MWSLSKHLSKHEVSHAGRSGQAFTCRPSTNLCLLTDPTTHILHISRASASPPAETLAALPDPRAHPAKHTLPLASWARTQARVQVGSQSQMVSAATPHRNPARRRWQQSYEATGVKRETRGRRRTRQERKPGEDVTRPAVCWRQRRHPVARAGTTEALLHNTHVNSHNRKDQTYHNRDLPLV